MRDGARVWVVMGVTASALLWAGCGGNGRVTAPITPASGNANVQSQAPVAFDATRAFSLLQKQVDFGPRAPNTASHGATRDWITEELRKCAESVTQQEFTATTQAGGTYHLTNIIGVINPAGAPKVMLCAHWDTRLTADLDPDPNNRNKPIAGANDGASGVAVLLEVARVLKAKKPKAQVIITFFDGEDTGFFERGDMFFGSKHFADNMGTFRPDYAVLIDMIGDANLNVNLEMNSFTRARALWDKVMAAAQAAGHARYFTGRQINVSDDHLPLLDKGVPAIDLIDFEYPDASNRYWHTLQDTPDKCSPHSLKVIGETLLKFVESAQ